MVNAVEFCNVFSGIMEALKRAARVTAPAGNVICSVV